MRIETVKLSKIKPNPKNPRLIKSDKYEKLKTSIQDFPEMLELREIVVDENYVILGGNMRYKAMKELGIKDCLVKVAEGLTEEQKNEFIIKDNVGFGDWDYDILANEWEPELLDSWGLDIPSFDNVDYSGKNKEIELNELEKFTIVLSYSSDEFFAVKKALSDIGKTAEDFLYKSLGL